MMLTLREAFERAIGQRKLKEQTASNYRRKITRYSGHLLDLPLDQLTKPVLETQIFSIVSQLQAASSKKSKDGYGTAQLVLATISMVYRTVAEDLGLPHETGTWPGSGLQYKLRKSRQAFRKLSVVENTNA